ncbi:MAG TPA: DUF2129 domain-containing protein [Cerasibacillus sp.]|uniref:YlbG family protein n=1 Tax=Cerasibacillus sp. TaxID=2498711 RepID=UPI002F414B8C
MEQIERQGIIVWFQHRKNLKKIRRYGHLLYASKRMKYAVLYVDQDKIDDIERRLLEYPFVSKVERSYKPFVSTTFEYVMPDKAKQYDYKSS